MFLPRMQNHLYARRLVRVFGIVSEAGQVLVSCRNYASSCTSLSSSFRRAFSEITWKMLRLVGRQATNVVRNSIIPRTASAVKNVRQSHDGPLEDEEQFNSKYIQYLNRPDIDHWEIRSAMNKLAGMDLVPDPTVICAALRACRRLNDYALTVRILETVKDKCGSSVKEIYPYILQEIRPTLDELGINTPEELGYDKPELALQSIDDIH